MIDIIDRLTFDSARCETTFSKGVASNIDEAIAEIKRLRGIEDAAKALKFSAYPAHGSGFVLIVSGGNVNELAAALGQSAGKEG